MDAVAGQERAYPKSLNLRPSGVATLVLAAIYSLAAFAAYVSRMPVEVKVLLLGLAAISVTTGLRAHAWRIGKKAVIGIAWHEEGKLELTRRGGATAIVARIEPTHSVAWPWLIALRLRLDGGGCVSLVLLSDAMHPDDFRRLQVWLRGYKFAEAEKA